MSLMNERQRSGVSNYLDRYPPLPDEVPFQTGKSFPQDHDRKKAALDEEVERRHKAFTAAPKKSFKSKISQSDIKAQLAALQKSKKGGRKRRKTKRRSSRR